MILPLLTAGAVLAYQYGTPKVFALSAAVLLSHLFPMVASVIAGVIVFTAIPVAILLKSTRRTFV